MKKWYESKTVWVNILVALIAFLESSQGAGLPYLTPEAWAMIIAVLNIFLRFVTNQPIEKSVI